MQGINTGAAARTLSTLDDDAWDDLVSFIEERLALEALGDVRLWRERIQSARSGTRRAASSLPVPRGSRAWVGG